MGSQLHVKIYEDLSKIHCDDWNRCLGRTGTPGLRYEFLKGLEQTGCVGESVGWLPRYISVTMNQKIVAVLACYLKFNSHGEFIFDWSWAEAAQRVGLPYYPKLVVASPFSPVNGRRFLIDPQLEASLQDEVFIVLLKTIFEWNYDIITGVHCLFIDDTEADKIQRYKHHIHSSIPKDISFLEFMAPEIRYTTQFHWHNRGYHTFDDFLGEFRSKKRNQIKKERKYLKQQGVYTQAFIDHDITSEHIDQAYHYYVNTIEKFYWGQQYLNRDFFHYLHDHMSDALCVLFAYQNHQVIGGTFNLLNRYSGVLYGRYWGCDDTCDLSYLHFEVCSYAGIEVCIENGWKVFEAGAGGGNHKHGRGFLAQSTYSAHAVYLAGFSNPIQSMLKSEKESLLKELSQLKGHVFKNI